MGKTAFCFAFCKAFHLKPLVVTDIQDFGRLDSSYDTVIMDDANLTKLPSTELLALLDTKADKTIRILSGIVFKRKNLIQIYTMNIPVFQALYPTLKEDIFGRRVVFVLVNNNFLKNVNLNRNINNTTINVQKSREEERKHILSNIEDMEKAYNETFNETF